MGGNGEDFALKADWGAMAVFRFEGFAAGFSKGMTGERLGVRMSLMPFSLFVFGEGKLLYLV